MRERQTICAQFRRIVLIAVFLYRPLTAMGNVYYLSTDVNLPYVGRAPDLGAFEWDPNRASQGPVHGLHQAVRDRDTVKVNDLLDAGADINEKDWLGYAPLYWACYFGYADLVELLMAKGADPNLVSDTGRTPLEIANSMEYQNIADLLLKQGAEK